jgi:hypothetical protein
MITPSISRRALGAGFALASLAPLSTRADAPHCDADLIDLDAALVRAWAAQEEIAPAHDRELEHAMSACRAIVDSILAVPARTLDGLRAKCRALSWCNSREFEGLAPDPGETFVVSRTTDLLLCDSILRDLLEITLRA